jgi:hypothetical protein
MVLGTGAANGESNTIGANERKLYRAQKSITFKGVFSASRIGAVMSAQITSCNNALVPYAGTRMVQEDYSHEEAAINAEEKLAYPNPVKNGSLYFNTTASSFQLTTITGIKIMEGQNVSHISIDNLHSGLYLLVIDGQTQKIVIE